MTFSSSAITEQFAFARNMEPVHTALSQLINKAISENYSYVVIIMFKLHYVCKKKMHRQET
jgi:hypothetical protein